MYGLKNNIHEHKTHTMRLQHLILFAMAFLCSRNATGQQSLELGGFLGISNYLGELQQTTFERNENNIALGIFTRWNLNPNLALKFQFYKGEISGRDANYAELQSIRERNLSFRSHLFELSLISEVSFVAFGESGRVAAPYLFFGVSGFHFNPQALYEGRWVSLQPLGTEGQTLPGSGKEQYKLFQFAIPLGIGFNIRLGDNMNIGFEAGLRKTFTDYLDDISSEYPDLNALQAANPMAATLSFRTPEVTHDDYPNPKGQIRGNPGQKDLYFFGGLTFSGYVLTREKAKRPKRRR